MQQTERIQIRTIWDIWREELPANFPKTKVIEALAEHWGLTKANVYLRLKSDNMKNFAHDVSFLYTNFGIGFDIHQNGYFFDRRKYEIIQQNEDLEAAKMFGLSK